MNNTLGQLSGCSPLTINHSVTLDFTTPAPRDFTENSSECASSILDERHILVQKIDSLKLQLAECQKREEYLRGINQSLREALSGLQNTVREQQEKLQAVQSSEGTFLRSATFQDSLASSQQLQTQQSSELERMRDCYERRLKDMADQYDQTKEQLEQRYLIRIQQIRQEIDAQAKLYIARQLQLMQDEIRVHFEKERAKAQAYLRSLLPERKTRFSSPSYFLPSPGHNSVKRQSHSRLVPELHTSCIETVQPQLNSHRSDAQKQHRDSFPSRKIDISVSTRNVATDLFCENCRTTFTPTEFFPHARNCQRTGKPQNSSVQSIQESRWQMPLQMRPESSLSDMPKAIESSEAEAEPSVESSGRQAPAADLDFQLIQSLLKKKEQIEYKIETLKYSKSSDNRRQRQQLQTDLDQLILIIQKKRKYKDTSNSSKKHLPKRSGKSFCSSIFKQKKNISRIYLEDRPLLKRNLNCHKQNSYTINQPMLHSQHQYPSLITSAQSSTPATPTTTKRFMKRY